MGAFIKIILSCTFVAFLAIRWTSNFDSGKVGLCLLLLRASINLYLSVELQVATGRGVVYEMNGMKTVYESILKESAYDIYLC